MDREQMVVRSLQEDNDLLKEQLQRERQKYASLETVREELERTRENQANQIAELQNLCSQEKAHNNSLLQEIEQLKNDIDELLE